MQLQLEDERKILHEFIDQCKTAFGKDLKAVVLFGSRASGEAKKYSDYDILVIAENLPRDWRQRDALSLELDRHGIFEIIFYTSQELEESIHAVNPLIMNIFDRSHKILYGEAFIGRIARLYSNEIVERHILRLGKNTWKITGGVNA